MKIKTRTLTFNCQIDGPKDGIPVVFSNSLASNVEMRHPQCEALSGEYRVIRYDTRGHGKSEVSAPYAFPQLVEDVIALLDVLDVDKVHFVGLSMGGMTALGLGLEHLNRLRSITVANCVARVPPAAHPMWDERAGIAREQGMRPLVTPSLERWFTEPTRRSRALELAWVGEMIADTPVDGYVAACGALKTLDYLDRLSNIKVLTLFIAGTHDAGAPLDAMKDMHSRVKGSQLVELDAAHISNLERPREFTAALSKFLRTH